MPENAANIREEAHVEHPIRFVQHQILQAGQTRVRRAEVIEQTARRCDDHVDAAAEGVLLRPHPDASVDSCAAQRRVNGQRVQVLGDLRRQLTCRREYERARRPTRFVDQPAEDLQ